MTPEQITALCTGVTSMLAAIGALIVSIRNNSKIDDVHHLVDGQHTAAMKEIKDLRTVITSASEIPAEVKVAELAKVDANKV